MGNQTPIPKVEELPSELFESIVQFYTCPIHTMTHSTFRRQKKDVKYMKALFGYSKYDARREIFFVFPNIRWSSEEFEYTNLMVKHVKYLSISLQFSNHTTFQNFIGDVTSNESTKVTKESVFVDMFCASLVSQLENRIAQYRKDRRIPDATADNPDNNTVSIQENTVEIPDGFEIVPTVKLTNANTFRVEQFIRRGSNTKFLKYFVVSMADEELDSTLSGGVDKMSYTRVNNGTPYHFETLFKLLPRLESFTTSINRDEELYQTFLLKLPASVKHIKFHPFNMELTSVMQYSQDLIDEIVKLRGTTVQSLRLSHQTIPPTIKILDLFPGLKRLDMFSCLVATDLVQKISQLSLLEHLVLSYCRFVDEESVRATNRLPISKLVIHNCNLKFSWMHAEDYAQNTHLTSVRINPTVIKTSLTDWEQKFIGNPVVSVSLLLGGAVDEIYLS